LSANQRLHGAFSAGIQRGHSAHNGLPTLRAMLVDPGLVAHCLELLSSLGPTRARRMFGGHGIYAGEHFVALILHEVLYLKADDSARPAFAAAGCQPFSYTTSAGQRALMAYWSAPDEAMDSPAAMQPWARLALASALRAAAAKRPARPRKPKAKARQTAPAHSEAVPSPVENTPELRAGRKATAPSARRRSSKA
jgi:DNA transformation protein and related proteins